MSEQESPAAQSWIQICGLCHKPFDFTAEHTGTSFPYVKILTVSVGSPAELMHVPICLACDEPPDRIIEICFYQHQKGGPFYEYPAHTPPNKDNTVCRRTA